MNPREKWQEPEVIAQLKASAYAGLSAPETAARMTAKYGVPFTRSAVSNMARRCGLTFQRANKAKPRIRRSGPNGDKPIAEFIGPPVRPLTILEVGPSQCRYPVEGTGADMKVCGAKTHKVSDRLLPYCRHHACIAYEAGKKRKAEKSDPVYQPRNAMAFDFRRGVA